MTTAAELSFSPGRSEWEFSPPPKDRLWLRHLTDALGPLGDVFPGGRARWLFREARLHGVALTTPPSSGRREELVALEGSEPRRRERWILAFDDARLRELGARSLTLEIAQLEPIASVEVAPERPGVPAEVLWRWRSPVSWKELLLLPLGRSAPDAWSRVQNAADIRPTSIALRSGAFWLETPAAERLSRRAAKIVASALRSGWSCRPTRERKTR